MAKSPVEILKRTVNFVVSWIFWLPSSVTYISPDVESGLSFVMSFIFAAGCVMLMMSALLYFTWEVTGGALLYIAGYFFWVYSTSP